MVFRVDILALDKRCVRLLRKVQAVCLEQSPVDYPVDEYAGDSKITSCFSHMIAGAAGLDREQPWPFPKACLMMKKSVEPHGDEELEKAKSRCFIDEDGKREVLEHFETPVEDIIPYRAVFLQKRHF
jgi:hypothetical protein